MTPRVGVVIGSRSPERWQHEVLEALLETEVELSILVVEESSKRAATPSKLGSKPRLWTAYFDGYVMRRSRALASEPMADRMAESVRVADSWMVGEPEFDALLWLAAGGPVESGVLSRLARQVWVADEEQIALDVFRDMSRNEACFVVDDHRSQESDEGECAVVGLIRHSYVRSLDQSLFALAQLLVRGVKRVQSSGRSVPLGPPRVKPGVSTRPSNGDVVWFLLRLLIGFVAAQVRGILVADLWNVGVIHAPIETLLDGDLPEIDWIEESMVGGHYLADPFGVPGERSLYALAESYDYRTGKGSIVALDLQASRVISTDVLGVEGHRSYPYTFIAGGETMLVVEAATDLRVEVYRATEYPTRWELFARALSDFPAVDPTIFHHDSRWWLFCTHGVRGPNHELWAWHAEDLKGPWRPHELNPIKIDVTSSRPAGSPFTVDGVLYRPGQDCAVTYGGAVVVNRVRELSPSSFREEAAVRLGPAQTGRYQQGLHTLSPIGQLTLVDGKRRSFVWPAVAREVSARWGKTWTDLHRSRDLS